MRVQTKKESKMKKNGRKQNVNTKEYETKELLSRFAPYYKPHMGTLCMDLFCAALTTICELVLPLIMRYITNEGIRDLAALSVKTILMLGALYLVLRIIDGIANYYMAYTGHVMGAKIETGMRKDAYAHLQKLSDTYYNNTKVGQIMGRITNDLFDVTEFQFIVRHREYIYITHSLCRERNRCQVLPFVEVKQLSFCHEFLLIFFPQFFLQIRFLR